jgi:hypothetical protein
VLDDNSSIEGLKISSGNAKIFYADKSEFASISSSPNYENASIKHSNTRANLIVSKPFLGGSKTRKWEFIVDGTRISANVVDDKFLSNLQQGLESFRVGSTMDVLLDITKEYDDTYKTWMNKKYTVKTVYEMHNPETATPQKLFPNDEV